LAQRLAEAHEDVLIVEAGGFEPPTDEESTISAEYVGRPFGYPITRCIEVGGTSNQWHGICTPLDPIDFERRPWIADSGWPISRLDLDPYYAEATRWMGLVDPPSYDPNGLEPPYRVMVDGIDRNRGIVDTKIFLTPKPHTRWKQPIRQLAQARALRCVIHSPALELVFEPGTNRVDHLVVGAGHATSEVRAEVFIVCAGALETPRLLLNSNRAASASPGNEHDNVGRYLGDHPTGFFSKIKFASPTDAPLFAGTAASNTVQIAAGFRIADEQQRANGLPNHYLLLRPSVSNARIPDDLRLSFLGVRSPRELTTTQIRGILTHRDLLFRILLVRFGLPMAYRYADLVFFTEQLPNPQSRVTVSSAQRDRYGYPIAKVDWQLTDDDFRLFDAYARLLFEQGMTSSQYQRSRVDPLDLWRRTLTSASHHLGTARMAASARTGVVDANLQVFGTRNVFVCDGSTFATAGSANPSLTIGALALRLAAFLVRAAGTPVIATARPN